MFNKKKRLVELLLKVEQMRTMRRSLDECADFLLENGVDIPFIRVGDYLWTNVGTKKVSIQKVKVISVYESESGYIILLSYSDKSWRITKEDVGETFFRTEEEARNYFLNSHKNVV